VKHVQHTSVALVLLFPLLALLPWITPVLVAMLIRLAFRKPRLSKPSGYAAMEAAVDVEEDIHYPSTYGNNTLSLYRLRTSMPKVAPVVVWVHGGAYVGGDKLDAHYYCTALASKGYVAVSMNYRRAPEAKFPSLLHQIADVYLWLYSVQEHYSLDMTRLVFAGDSAGAHAAALFALVQTNFAYAKEIGIKPVVPSHCIRGLMLYCGPYNVQLFQNMKGFMGFFAHQAAWAYFGTRHWAQDFADIATVKNHITKDFPATLLADGNAFSFTQHGIELATTLVQHRIPVTTYFAPSSTQAWHAFQFLMASSAGQECFSMSQDFLREVFSQ